MRFSDPRGFGIKKRSWFGGRSRPAFMEPMPPGGPPGVPQGVPPPRDGNYVRLVGSGEGVPPPNGGYERGELGGSGGGGGGGGALQLNNRKRSSSFPLKGDAGYIGYLSDDESVGGSGDEGEGGLMSIVDRRRRELIGSDISFSGCMLMMITVCGLLMLFIFAASPWGIPPPRRLGAP